MIPTCPLQKNKTGLLLKIHAQPNAKKNQIVGIHGSALKVKIHAPPEDGKANQEIINFMSEILKIPKLNIRISSGESSRQKSLQIQNITLAEAAERLGLKV